VFSLEGQKAMEDRWGQIRNHDQEISLLLLIYCILLSKIMAWYLNSYPKTILISSSKLKTSLIKRSGADVYSFSFIIAFFFIPLWYTDGHLPIQRLTGQLRKYYPSAQDKHAMFDDKTG